jgi:dihydrofolate synthase/folylpolyglutamate synthase
MENIVETCKQIFAAVEQNNYDVRFFEIVTMIGLLEFKRAKCDYVVFECGLGGSLDATNIVDVPDLVCSAITSIGLDHMDVLGDSINDIAAEKAGVIKAGAPCVVGPTCKDLEPIRIRAKEQGDNMVEVAKYPTYGEDNDKIVEEILKIVCNVENRQLDAEILEMAKSASQPCRFEII